MSPDNMDAHFRAFSFVDQITSVQEGRQVRGRFTIPTGLEDFPLALVGEAVGQLAAWAAMAEVEFNHRPVAGLAGRIELGRLPCRHGMLELGADLEHVDPERVAYSGTAHMDGQLVMQLQDCVGPMVRVADFDDPLAVRRRFDLLCQRGAEIGSFPGLPKLELEHISRVPGRSVSASINLPTSAPLFADHFPRRAVFPGSLLMHLNLQLGAALASDIPQPNGGCWVAGEVVNMKLRTFIPPGETLQMNAGLKQVSDGAARLALETRVGNEVIATASLVLNRKEAE